MFLILSAITLFHQNGFACLCNTETVENELRASSAVFTGKVLSMGEQYGPEFKLVEFQVWRVWKGPRVSRIEVKTSTEKDECGYPFEKNKEYLVYATGDKTLRVSLCSRTAPLEKADSDIKKLMTLGKSIWIGSSRGPRDPFVLQEGDSRSTQRSVPTPKTLTVESAVILGIINKGAEYTALIRAADGKAFSMKVGDKLYDGEIINIDSDSVVFRQNNKTVRKTLRPFPE